MTILAFGGLEPFGGLWWIIAVTLTALLIAFVIFTRTRCVVCNERIPECKCSDGW
jgi:hypothetical protein